MINACNSKDTFSVVRISKKNTEIQMKVQKLSSIITNRMEKLQYPISHYLRNSGNRNRIDEYQDYPTFVKILDYFFM